MSSRILAGNLKGWSGKINRCHRSAHFQGKDNSNNPTATTKIKDRTCLPFSLPDYRKDCFQEELCLWPGDQNSRGHQKRKRPELSFAEDIGRGLMCCPTSQK